MVLVASVAADLARLTAMVGVTGVITIDPQRNARKPAVILRLQNGKPSFVVSIDGVQVAAQSEGAAFGAALQALWAMRRAAGESITPADVCNAHIAFDPARAASPDPARAAAYAAAYQRFLQHLDAARTAPAASSPSLHETPA